MHLRRLLYALLVVAVIGVVAVTTRHLISLQLPKIPTARDQEEANGIIQSLESGYPFRVMSIHDSRPAVYERPHPDYSVILVFGEYTAAERAKILAVAKSVRREKATKPVHLYFYPRELDEIDLLQKEILP
jgi:hypothetical protein